MAEAIRGAGFARERYTLAGTEQAKYWTVNYPNRTIEALSLYRIIRHYIAAHFPDRALTFSHGYVNSNSFGDHLSIHPDSEAEGALTALYYVNDTWNADWGGETLFYDDAKEALACVTPKPRRLVLFDARILHRGSPPLRSCYASRLVLALKFEPRAPKKKRSA